MFAESGAYNVYAVAETRELRTLTGGVDVVPQHSFAELAAVLHHEPNIIVVPAMLDTGSPQNVPVLDWLRKHGHAPTLLFSWCAGAEVLAASGLIDGKTVTTNWGDIDRYERAYPAVHWRRGERYIDSGTLLTTGGITAGVDATLHLLARLNGQDIADKVGVTKRVGLFGKEKHTSAPVQQLKDISEVLGRAKEAVERGDLDATKQCFDELISPAKHGSAMIEQFFDEHRDLRLAQIRLRDKGQEYLNANKSALSEMVGRIDMKVRQGPVSKPAKD